MRKVKQKVKQFSELTHEEIDAEFVKQILAGIDGSRTHRGYRLAPTNGFEVREAHRSSSIPAATTHQSDNIKASVPAQTSRQCVMNPWSSKPDTTCAMSL